VPDLKEGQEVGGWKLLRFLGEGGNAEVWLAHRGGDEAAVKFLKTLKTESLRWERFRREVEYVSSLGAEPGVLPIFEFELPERPRRGERAWYSMPEATSIEDALAGSTLREVDRGGDWCRPDPRPPRGA
jgi:serine/threonine protein kinase